MDSPHFRPLCFLLLTVTAPHPSIAMPSGNPGERTQGSSSGKTNVAVYHCENCDISICDQSAYESFARISETQVGSILSPEESLTYTTHIRTCFWQQNTSYRGIYAIYWQNDMGAGDACGSLDHGASSENGRGNITKICCAVEVKPNKPSSSLMCYMSSEDLQTREASVSTTREGSPGIVLPLNDGNNSIGITTTTLILGMGTAALIFYV